MRHLLVSDSPVHNYIHVTPFPYFGCIILLKLFLFSVQSFVELVRYLLSLPEVPPFLSRRLTQDPLGIFFGLQRQRGRVNENPNVAQFLKNTQALRVIQTCTGSVRGNCRGRGGTTTFPCSKSAGIPHFLHSCYTEMLSYLLSPVYTMDPKENLPLFRRPGHKK